MNNLKTNLANLCNRYGITSLYVFGSRAPEIEAIAASTLNSQFLHPPVCQTSLIRILYVH